MIFVLRQALRSLLKTPGYTGIALLTLTLGIGVNTTMFTVINTLLFQQLPFAEPAALVRVFRTAPQSQRWPHSIANYLDLKAQNHAFSTLAGYSGVNFSYSAPGQPAERLRGMKVTAEFFPLLGVGPQLGRAFTPEESRPGGSPVVILSESCWTRRFAADPAVIGRQIRIDGALATVVGVMPPRFNAPLIWGAVEIWRPLVFSAQDEQNRAENFMPVIGRLAPGYTLAQAQTEVTGIATRLAADHPLTNAGNGLRLMPLADSGQDEASRRLSWFVMSLAGFVLLIACANLANLQFARTTGRSREYAIRLALGASRWRIMRELLVESLLLALGGTGGGLLVSLWGNDLIAQQMAAGPIPDFQLHLDLRVFGFALAASLASGLAFGLLPAWFASRSNVNDALKQQARGSTADRSHHRLRHGLIVAEVALALILLTGAGVFVRGLQRFTQRDPGWRTAGLVTGFLSLPASRYPDHPAQSAFFGKLADRLAADPVFQQATMASSLPTGGYNSSTSIIAEGRPAPVAGQEPLTNLVFVNPAYFDTLGIQLRQGRAFTRDDRADTPHVVIINESLAHALWPGENPIGRRIGDPDPTDRNWREIVGVVNDVAFPAQPSPPDTRFQMYVPLMQDSFGFVALAVRGHGTPEALGQELQRTVAALDPDQPVFNLVEVDTAIKRSLGNFTLIGGLLGGFAALGLCLAALGIYGVLAGFIAQRRTEIGLRMALGAQVGDVLRLVLGRGLRLSGLGIVLGLAGAAAVVRLLQRIMPELGAPDPLTIVAIVTTLLAVALLACWLPARRATRVDPISALRAD